MDLLERIRARTARVGVIGLGYIGLPLAVRIAQAGFRVIGYDSNSDKVAGILTGGGGQAEAPGEVVGEAIASGSLVPTSDAKSLSEVDVAIICVPTPLSRGLPDLSYLDSAVADIAANGRRGMLVVLESTSYPGTTEERIGPALEKTGWIMGRDFYLGFSPERLNPGSQMDFTKIPKLVSGADPDSALMVGEFYGSVFETVVPLSSPKVGEMAKLLENTYRHVNLALINEVAMLCHDLSLDVWEVIDAASTKPFGFQPFYPGPGWGGHCIPVDPIYLSWRVKELGETARFVELAMEINRRMPEYVVERAHAVLESVGVEMESARILVLGVTYKKDTPDIRESPALVIIERLIARGSMVSFHDPYISSLEQAGIPIEGVELNQASISSQDLVLLVTDHSSYDWEWIASAAKAVFDTRNAFKGVEGPITRL